MRGIYVRKDNRTRAHVFVIMLAYLVAYELRRLWCDTELTIEEGIDELSTLCATEVIIGSFSIHTIPKPRPTGEILLNKAKIDLPDAIPCRNIDVYTRKKLVDQRKNSINQLVMSTFYMFSYGRSVLEDGFLLNKLHSSEEIVKYSFKSSLFQTCFIINLSCH